MSLRGPFAILCVVLLNACMPAGSTPDAADTSRPAEDVPAKPGFTVLVDRTGALARGLIERIAAQCWLDGVVGGAALVVDRQSGKIIIVSETDELLIVENEGLEGSNTRWRLSGPAADEARKAERLRKTLGYALKSGDTSCPRLRT